MSVMLSFHEMTRSFSKNSIFLFVLWRLEVNSAAFIKYLPAPVIYHFFYIQF